MSSSPRDRATTTYLLARIFHTLRATRIEPLLRPHGVTSTHYTLLTVLEDHPGESSAQLARRFHVTPQTMGQMLAALEQRGLVSRAGDGINKRVLRVQITPAGRQLVRKFRRQLAEIEAEVFGAPDDPSLRQFRDKLYEVAGRLRQPGGVDGEGGNGAD